MKKQMMLVLALLPAFFASAQVVDKVDIWPMKEVQYIRVNITPEVMGKQYVMTIDYGQPNTSSTDYRVKGADGKKVMFESGPHALNYLHGLGWELRHVYTEYKNVLTTENFLFERSPSAGK